jgi:hypothetical protein
VVRARLRPPIDVLAVTTDFPFLRVAFTPRGNLIAAVYGSSNTAGAIQFWRVNDDATVALFPKPNHVHAIAFSPQPGVYAYTEFGGRVTVAFAPFVRPGGGTVSGGYTT